MNNHPEKEYDEEEQDEYDQLAEKSSNEEGEEYDENDIDSQNEKEYEEENGDMNVQNREYADEGEEGDEEIIGEEEPEE